MLVDQQWFTPICSVGTQDATKKFIVMHGERESGTSLLSEWLDYDDDDLVTEIKTFEVGLFKSFG